MINNNILDGCWRRGMRGEGWEGGHNLLHTLVYLCNTPSSSATICQLSVLSANREHRSISQAFYWLLLSFTSGFFCGSLLNFWVILLKLAVCNQFACALASASFLYILISLFRSFSHSHSCTLACTLGLMLDIA